MLLRCKAVGSPEPFIIWHKDNIPVQAAFKDRTEGIFKVAAASTEDSGRYKCIAVTEYGVDEKECDVTVVNRTMNRTEREENRKIRRIL